MCHVWKNSAPNYILQVFMHAHLDDLSPSQGKIIQSSKRKHITYDYCQCLLPIKPVLKQNNNKDYMKISTFRVIMLIIVFLCFY